jgi:SAM-dependent methyltransferase
MNEKHLSAPDRIHFLSKVTLALPELDSDGRILNLAHGGEDILGKNASGQVIAINLSVDELADIAPDSLGIVMSPCDLKFVDASFDLAVAFFSMLFVGCGHYSQMFREIFRVLKPGGRFLFWEALIPKQGESSADIVAIPVQVLSPAGPISAGYGGLWPGQPFQPDGFEKLAQEAGFTVESRQSTEGYFFFEFLKPAP